MYDWPLYANITSWRLYLEAFTRSGGDEYSRERGDEERVVGVFAIAPMCTSDAVKFATLLHRAYMTGGVIGVRVPQSSNPTTAPVRAHHEDSDGEITPFSDGFAFTDFVSPAASVVSVSSTAAEGSTSLQLEGVTDGTAVAPGSWISSGDTLLQVVSSEAVGVETYDVTVKPPLRSDITSGSQFIAGAAVAKLRLRVDRPAPEVVYDFPREVSQPIILELEEAR